VVRGLVPRRLLFEVALGRSGWPTGRFLSRVAGRLLEQQRRVLSCSAPQKELSDKPLQHQRLSGVVCG